MMTGAPRKTERRGAPKLSGCYAREGAEELRERMVENRTVSVSAAKSVESISIIERAGNHLLMGVVPGCVD